MEPFFIGFIKDHYLVMGKKIFQKIASFFISNPQADYKLYKAEYMFYLFPEKFSFFHGLFESKAIHTTPVPIHFLTIGFLMSPQKIIEEMGEPQFKFRKKVEEGDYKIYFYRKVIENKNVILQIHFLNNQNFAMCHTFVEPSATAIKSITKNILAKYQIGNVLEEQALFFKDQHGNAIHIIDNPFKVHLVYLSASATLKSLANKQQLGNKN
jgi:hypothetical protein